MSRIMDRTNGSHKQMYQVTHDGSLRWTTDGSMDWTLGKTTYRFMDRTMIDP